MLRPFDEKTFQEKLKRLYELDPYEGFYEEPIGFVPVKTTRKDDWRKQDGPEGSVYHAHGSFFKYAMIAAVGKFSGKIFWKQPILIQEDTRRYDHHTCFSDVGEAELPLQINKDKELELGIGLQTPPGSFGEPEPCIPRRSFSNIHTKPFPKPLLIFEAEEYTKRRQDFRRQTGLVQTRVALNPSHTNVVWFLPEEASQLLDRGYIRDLFSEALLGRFFRKELFYRQMLSEKGLL